ncbi:hypothetical protein K0M31_013972 [Melipona bicolor]|uniref:Uncharacterized protein n=1 Tax=Melipona bicolor TaxID=60889 RepID=A0AA40KTU9_9HYME|nr:hypothetical protein K0M31_013972 [Melipona bicolor]
MKRKERKKQSKNMAIQSKQLQPHGVSINMETSWVAQELKSNLSNMVLYSGNIVNVVSNNVVRI